MLHDILVEALDRIDSYRGEKKRRAKERLAFGIPSQPGVCIDICTIIDDIPLIETATGRSPCLPCLRVMVMLLAISAGCCVLLRTRRTA